MTPEAPRGGARTPPGRTGVALLTAAVLFVFGPSISFGQETPYHSLRLFWTAPGDDGNEGLVNSYQLRFDTVPAEGDVGSWWERVPLTRRRVLLPPFRPAGSTDSTVVTGLTPGTTYYFVLRALDEAGNISDYSNVAVGTTPTCTPPPSWPADFAAETDTGEVRVSWSASDDTTAVALNLYRASGAGGAWTRLETLPLSVTSYTDRGVAPGGVYRYRAAWIGVDCEGPFSAEIQVLVPGASVPPPSGAAGASDVQVYPNPARGPVHLVLQVVGEGEQDVRLRLHDLNGHWITTVAEVRFPPGETRLSWNRMDRVGRLVAPGYYEIHGTIGRDRIRERLILIP